jgi:hypothetical protein
MEGGNEWRNGINRRWWSELRRSRKPQYEVESIIASRGSGVRAQYLVKRLGYSHWRPLGRRPPRSAVHAMPSPSKSESWRTMTQSKLGRM